MYRLFIFHFLFLLSLFAACESPEERAEVVLKLGHNANDQDIWHKSLEYFAARVDSLSEGKVEVRLFPSEQLGKELDMIRSIEAGIDDMTISGESMQNWAEITAFSGMPYLIRDLDHLDKVVNGPIGDKIAAEMIEEIGLRPLAYFARGPRHLTSNRPIRTPEDLQGIILRVPSVPISVKTWEALGAKPTPMTFSEVFTALQQGTVEAQENPFALIHHAGFYEVQKYVNLTGHVIGWVYVVIGEEQFQALKPEYQQIILQAGQAMQAYHQELFSHQEEQLKKNLAEKGMEFVEVDVTAFQEKASKAVMENIPERLVPLYQEIIHMPRDHAQTH
jgi:tripartite ATP-independent transporter DctP family solute receptor